MFRAERARQIARALSLLSGGALPSCSRGPIATTSPDAVEVNRAAAMDRSAVMTPRLVALTPE